MDGQILKSLQKNGIFRFLLHVTEFFFFLSSCWWMSFTRQWGGSVVKMNKVINLLLYYVVVSMKFTGKSQTGCNLLFNFFHFHFWGGFVCVRSLHNTYGFVQEVWKSIEILWYNIFIINGISYCRYLVFVVADVACKSFIFFFEMG